MESRARYKDWRWPVCLVLCLALLIACNGETAVSAGSDNDAIVTQVYYAVNTGHASTVIQNFPKEYEYLESLINFN